MVSKKDDSNKLRGKRNIINRIEVEACKTKKSEDNFDYYALGCKEEKRNVKAEDIEKRRFKSKNDKMTTWIVMQKSP